MTQSIRELMTTNPTVCEADRSIVDAARIMREQDIGDVLVEHNGQLCGLVTDRDIVVRAVADGGDVSAVRLGDICTAELFSIGPDDTVRDAVAMMRERAVRRVPVVEAGKAVGIVSIGDLAVERDEDSTLADISAAPPND